VTVQALVLTDGGLWGVPPPGLGIVQAREQESRRAAAVLGCAAPAFCGFADRSLRQATGLAGVIAQHARALGADVVLAPSPWEVHPDHRAAAMAALQAVGLLGQGHVLVQYELGAALLPNVLVDVTPAWERKREAMACFASQHAMQRYDRHVEALNVFRTYTLAATVRWAEAFRVATPEEAAADPFGLVRWGMEHPVAAHMRGK
jgi:LmbE family N-acetylglucosaminyl deacetylase